MSAGRERLEGKVAIITGAASGLGRAAADAFVRAGARVVATDRDREALASAVTEIADRHGTPDAANPIVGVVADVTDAASMEAAVAATVDTFGAVHVLYANAGVDGVGSVTETSEELWHRVMAVNATGVWLSMRAALPELERAGGSIVVQASTAGLVGVPGLAAYSAAKGAVIALTRQAAVDYGPKGVRVNVICPGTVVTPLVERTMVERGRGDDLGAALRQAARHYPLGRLGEVEDVAACAVFLASDESAWMTGAVVPVDGGYTAR